MSEKIKTKSNLVIAISDAHFGHESCLYETYWHTIEKLCDEIETLENRYEWNKVFLCVVGDVVSGTQIYRNQYLESHVQKNEDVISFGSYLLHRTIKMIEETVGNTIQIFIVVGTHEGLMRAIPHNFAIGIARRLSAYNYSVRYASKYFILNLASGFDLEKYQILFYHGYGGADYSSASPSLIRELTTVHSQLSTQRGLIIQRFCVGHSHWLEIGRAVLGIRYDCLGGFMRWDKKISNRESGVLYYTYTEDGEFDVKGVSGLKFQIEESAQQGLHSLNMRYVAEQLHDAYEFEIECGILHPEQEDEK